MNTEEGTLVVSSAPLNEEESQKAEEWRAYNLNLNLMREIASMMKETPHIPSEVTKDSDMNPLVRVEMPEAGGVLTYMLNNELPFKGFPFNEFVDKIDVIKKIQRAALSSIYHSTKKRSWFQLIRLALVPWLFGDLIKAYIYVFYRQIDRFKIKPIRYSDAIRELHRAFTVANPDEQVSDQEFRYQVRDIVCMVLEFDNAYRFRFQDIIVELDKEKLAQNPSKEIVRLLNELSSRELVQEVKDTWKLARYFLPIYLRFNKPLRHSLVNVLTALDLEKVKLSPEDIQFSKTRKDYKFGFM